MTDEAHTLATLELTAQQLNALRAMQKTVSGFEPLANLPGVGETLVRQLLGLGLVEVGDNPRYAGHGYSAFYKMTNLGWRVLDRGRSPRRR